MADNENDLHTNTNKSHEIATSTDEIKVFAFEENIIDVLKLQKVKRQLEKY
jgi:hypothetical protein